MYVVTCIFLFVFVLRVTKCTDQKNKQKQTKKPKKQKTKQNLIHSLAMLSEMF
jgi:large-conductance mechanosensitive channel